MLARSAIVGTIALLAAGDNSDPSIARVVEDDFAHPIFINLENGRLWSTIRKETACAEVLGEISQAAGVKLYVYGELGTIPTSRFKDLSLGEGIQLLVGRHDWSSIIAGMAPRGRSAGADLAGHSRLPVRGCAPAGASPSSGRRQTRPLHRRCRRTRNRPRCGTAAGYPALLSPRRSRRGRVTAVAVFREGCANPT